MYTQLSSNDVSTAAVYGAGGAPVPGVAAASSAAAYGRPVSGAGAFALAHGAPGTPPPAMPPPVLSRLSEDTYAFGNETMGYFYIPRASLGDAAETGNAKTSAKKTSLVDAGDDAQDETRDAATGGSDARERASSREGKQSVSEPIPRAVLAAAAAAAKAAYGHSASAPGARTPPPPKPASGAGYAAYSPGFDPASALGFSPFVPPSPGPYSPAATRFPEPVDPSRLPFARASPSEERKAPARASSFLTFAAAAMARKRAGEADAGSVTEHKASGEAADAAEEEATNRDASSDASSDASPPGPEGGEGGVLSGSWGPSGPSTPGGSQGTFPGSDYPYPSGYGYALPASLTSSPQVAAAAAYAYEAEYANAMRAWSLAHPEVSGLAEVADALSLRSTPAGTPPGEASPAASSVSSRAASPTFPLRHQVGPFAYPSSGDARWFAHAPGGPLRSAPFPLSPPGFGVEAGPYAADGMYPPSPPTGWFPRADGGGVHGVHGAFYAGPSFCAYGHSVSPRNGSSRRGKHRRDKDIAANRRDAVSPLAASLRDTRSRTLADRAGLGSASGAVLVGSGGDGLGEATRGPRAAAAAAASAASEDAKRSETAASVAQELAKSSPAHDVASSLDAADASLSSAARASSLAANRAARAGVAADPEFRDAVWRRADRNVPMADSKELFRDRFDGELLEGLDFASGHDRFFVIKSYTEDDVHKSVKYGKWTSTATGNARLDAAFSRNGDDDGDENEDVFGGAKTVDAAFLELARAAERALEERNRKEHLARRDDADFDVEKARRETAEAETQTETETSPQTSPQTSPLFDRSDDASEDVSDDALRATRRRPRVLLFFSVNSSGHFCGVAEMTSAVDFDSRADFWQRDKWPGCFDVRWHYVKDVPNASLRHIRLVESDRKPVTNARDAQEVEPNSARLVLNVFRNFTTNTSLLDDFEFYGAREKARADIKSAKARSDGERGTGKTNANANAFGLVSQRRGVSNAASFMSAPPAVVFPGSNRYPYVQTPSGTYFSTEHTLGGDATRFPYGTDRVNPSPLAYGHSVAGDPRGAPFARAAQSMSASAPAFAPGGLRGAGSRYDTSLGSPYGSGASLSSRGPKFGPAQPERNAPKASPYRDAVGAR